MKRGSQSEWCQHIIVYGDDRREDWAAEKALEMNKNSQLYCIDFGYNVNYPKDIYARFPTIYHTTQQVAALIVSLKSGSSPATLLFLDYSRRTTDGDQRQMVKGLTVIGRHHDIDLFICAQRETDVEPDIRRRCEIIYK